VDKRSISAAGFSGHNYESMTVRRPSGRRLVRLAVLFTLSLATLTVRADGGRQELNFNPDWRFTKTDPTNAFAESFNDEGWNTVSTPHTFNDTDTFNNFELPGLRGEENQWSGRTWYRKTFVAPESWSGQKVFIEFQAVRQFGEVFLNGQRLGICKNGFIPFGFDLTSYLKIGATNVLAVMCDNRFMINPMPGAKETGLMSDTLGEFETKVNKIIPDDVNAIRADQIPWNNPQWHPAMGGIYRDVKLYVTDPLHITLPLYDFLQTEGPYIYPTDVSDKSAKVNVEIPIQNDRISNEEVDVSVQILDHDGKVVSTGRVSPVMKIASTALVKANIAVTVPNPNLWQPDFPYLYRAKISLSIDGKEIDSQEVPFGIRTVNWDANTGFAINGKHLRLHGWGQKPVDEWPGLGDAQPDWLHFYTLDLMKQAGANWVRWGHCAAGPAQIASCDMLGLMVEQPGVDGESDTVGAAWQIRADAFRDALIYYRNNPSIMIWEGGNQKVTEEHARQLRGYMDEFDPHGGRAYAHRRANAITGKYMDVCIGTEGGREISSLPVVEGEYDREESPRRVWDEFTPPNTNYNALEAGQTYNVDSEEYAVNEVVQYVHKTFAANHSGGANWIFSDSTSGGRNTTEVSRASGEVDGVRLPKEAYYVVQAMFRDDPQVHIIGHWNYPAGTKKTVYVASNCGDVELFVNGKSLGHGKVSDRFLFTFENVAFEAGEIEAVASYHGEAVATNSIQTAGEAVALRLTPVIGPENFEADGSDVALVDVEAVDAQGRRVPTFQQRVDFDCSGPAIWRGGYNSGQPGSINNPFLDLECGINRIAVRSTLQPGTVAISASCPGLKPASVAIASHPVGIQNGIETKNPPLPEVTLARPDFLRVSEEPAATGDGQPSAGAGRYIVSFSYSGPTTIVHVEQNATDGRNIFVDRDTPFAGLPPALVGADWVQGANGDSIYSAVDLMQLAVKGGTVVSVAHDDRLPLPTWLEQKFRRTGMTLKVNGHAMTIYQHRAKTDESLTLGSNTDDPSVTTALAYVVFVSRLPLSTEAMN
jgi:beta-galactosidase